MSVDHGAILAEKIARINIQFDIKRRALEEDARRRQKHLETARRKAVDDAVNEYLGKLSDGRGQREGCG